MSSVPPVDNSAPPASTAKSKSQVDYESFLTLLVAQMKNQDPTKPMDSTDFVAQLATFSQVEQSVQSNAKLDELLQSSAFSQADSLIGREITSSDGEITGVVSEVKINSDGITAILGDGTEVDVGEGITIAAADQ